MKLILAAIGGICLLYCWSLPQLSYHNAIVALSLSYEENSLVFFVSTVYVLFICSLFSKKIIHDYLNPLLSTTLFFLAFHEFIATPYVQQKYTQQMNKLYEDSIPGLVLTNIKKDRTSLNKAGVQAEHLGKQYEKLLKNSKDKLTTGSSEEQTQKKRDLATLYILSQDDDQKTQGLSLLISLAEDNDCKSKMLLGFCYYEGQGVSRDYIEAVKWFKKAADCDSALSMNNLGVCYYEGQGVSRDYIEAVKWFKKAADLGQADAMFNLGVCYYEGQGVSPGGIEAVKWFKKAADLGQADAMFKLQHMYQTFSDNASEYAVLSARIPDTSEYAGMLTAGYLKAQIEYLAQSVNWGYRAANLGHAGAMYSLGECHHNGKGVTQDYVMAHVWYDLACRRKFQDACGVRDKLATIMPIEDIQKAQDMASKKYKELTGLK